MDTGFDFRKAIGSTEVRQFCGMNLKGFMSATNLDVVLSEVALRDGLDPALIKQFTILAIKEELALQHWIAPYQLFSARLYGISSKILEDFDSSERREFRENWRAEMSKISRQFVSPNPSHSTFEQFKAKISPLRVILGTYMHQEDYFLADEVQHLSLKKILQANFNTRNPKEDEALESQTRNLFISPQIQ